MLALLFGSGFSALVYQVLWLRLLGLVFGVTVHAASTVLAAFMGGLAIGSVVAGRLADRVTSPLRWFGLVEILVGISALCTPWLLDGLESVYRLVYSDVSGSGTALTSLRFAGSLAALIVPTTLMGATMPLAVRAATFSPARFGMRVGLLYAANTTGALAGALITGYYLVSSIGIARSFQLAAAVNVVIGLTALLWPRQHAGLPAAAAEGSVQSGMVPSPAERRGVLLVCAVSGFVGLALEVVWFRSLVMFLAATTYVFTIVLAIVLGGIAAGSAMVTPTLRRNRDWIARLAVFQVAIAIAAVASLAAQVWTYSRGWRTSAVLQGSALSVLPTMLLMGAAFPIALQCWTVRGDGTLARAGARVGRFYMTNLLGAIAGAVAAGFVLIPRLGARGSLIAVASLSLLSGLVLLALIFPRRRRFAAGVAVASIVIFITVAASLSDPLSAGLARRYGNERMLWREEGQQATVTVQQGPEHRALYLDGLHQTNDSAGMVAMHGQIGSLGMAVHPRPEDALVIGLGGGATAGAVARFAAASVDVVELSPSVVRGADWFRHANGDVLRRPNVQLRVDDGRNYLLLTPRRYDVITADIIQPFHAGAGNLYSLEYYQLARRTLREGGLMVQWIGHRPEEQYKHIARTFLAAFPQTTAWAGGTLLLGSLEPLRLSRAAYEARLADPSDGPALTAAGLGSFEALLSQFSAGPAELRTFVGDGPVLTDDRPLVEYFRGLPPSARDVPLEQLRGSVQPYVER